MTLGSLSSRRRCCKNTLPFLIIFIGQAALLSITSLTEARQSRKSAAFASSSPPPKFKPSDVTSKIDEFIASKTDSFRNPFFAGPKTQEDETRPSGILEELNIESNMEPRRFYVVPKQVFSIFTASFPAVFRLGTGVFADGYRLSIDKKDATKYSLLTLGNYRLVESCSPTAVAKAARQPLVIYEFETCPFCRKVREAVSILSLEVTYKPCPKNGPRYRKEIKSEYGDRATFPFMRDPNTGVEMFESDKIISYLFKAYGDGKVPFTLRAGMLTPLTAALGLLPRLTSGGQYKTSNPPAKELVLWAYEGSPFCKVVRETLCELEIPHTQVSCPRGSPNRQKLFERKGRFQVPYLEDPNYDVSLFESAAIIEYLEKQYGVKKSPVKYL